MIFNSVHIPGQGERQLEVIVSGIPGRVSRLINWARTVGPDTAQLFTTILESTPHPEMGYRSCLGIFRLGNSYTAERLEAAAREPSPPVRAPPEHQIDSQTRAGSSAARDFTKCAAAGARESSRLCVF
jgi:hypothetical protein